MSRSALVAIATGLGAMSLFATAAERPATFHPPSEPLPPGARQRIGSTLYRVNHGYSGPLTADGKGMLLAYTNDFHGSILLDLTTGKRTREYRLGQGVIPPPRVLTRGSYAIANNKNEIQVIELATSKVVHRWTGAPFDWKDGLHTSALSASTDGKTIAFGEEARVVIGIEIRFSRTFGESPLIPCAGLWPSTT